MEVVRFDLPAPQVQTIRGLSDLPPPVGGVITLEPRNSYVFHTSIDLLGARIEINHPGVTLIGSQPAGAVLSSTGLDPATPLVTTTQSVYIRYMGFSHGHAVQATGSTFQGSTFYCTQAFFLNCSSPVTVENIDSVYLVECIFSGCGPFCFDGHIGGASFRDTLASPAAGESAFLFKSTANFDRAVDFVGLVFRKPDGLAYKGIEFEDLSATLAAPESVVLDFCIFRDNVTPLVGITPESNQAMFFSCIGVDSSVECGHFYMVGNATSTTIGAASTPVKILGSTSAGSNGEIRFSHSSNRLTYTGGTPGTFRVFAGGNFSGLSNNEYRIYAAVNGVIDPSSVTSFRAPTGTNAREGVFLQGVIHLDPGDYVELWIENVGGTGSCVAESLNLTAVRLK